MIAYLEANFLNKKYKKRDCASHNQDGKSARKISQSEDSDIRNVILVILQEATFSMRLITLDPVLRQACISPPLHPII